MTICRHLFAVAAVVLVATATEAQEPPPGPTPTATEVRVSVALEGLEGELETNASAAVALIRQEGEPLTPARARALYSRAPQEVGLALEPFGRYQPTVDAELVEGGDEWSARLTVDPGPVTTVTRVDFALTGEGAADSGFVALADSFPIAEGDTLFHLPYETAKSELARYAANMGYFDAQFDTAQIVVDRAASTAEIILHFSTGPRRRFGPISVEQDVLDRAYVDGYVTAVEGEPFDASVLRASQVALTTGPWFGRADIELGEADGDNLEVPVTFQLSPAPSQRYEVAAGYGTDTGIRGTLGARFRRLNRKAHNAEGEIRVSQIEASIAARYNIPRAFPSTAVYSVFASFGDVSPTWSSTLVGTAGLSMSRSRGPVRETVSLQWEWSDFEAAELEGDASLLIPKVDWSWVQANDRILATRGHRLTLAVSGAHEAVLSSATFATVRAGAKFIRPLGSRSRVLARADVGRIFTDDITALPPTRRFVTGGDQTVRGYGFETLGPELGEEGLLVGGKALVAGSLEADFEVIPNWRLAAFGDVGNALPDFSDFSVEYGTGFGVRWASPLGLIRFDFAFPVSDPDRNFRVHFVLGPDL